MLPSQLHRERIPEPDDHPAPEKLPTPDDDPEPHPDPESGKKRRISAANF